MVKEEKEKKKKTNNGEDIIDKDEIIAQEKEEIIHILKDKYNQGKSEFEDFSKKTKNNIKKNPYHSMGIAAGLGTLLGVGLGMGIYSSIQNRNKIDFDIYKKNIFKNHDFNNFSKNLKNDIRKKPYQSTSLALGLGVLVGIGIKSLNGCLKKGCLKK